MPSGAALQGQSCPHRCAFACPPDESTGAFCPVVAFLWRANQIRLETGKIA
jgi:hypothetical protein